MSESVHSDRKPRGYMSVLNWSRKYSVSKAWACRLCVAGRVEGAVFDDGRWWIPEDSGMPERRVSERLKVLHDAAVRREQRKPVASAADLGRVRRFIDAQVAQGWTFDEAGNGFYEGKYYMPIDGWDEAAWEYCLSIGSGR